MVPVRLWGLALLSLGALSHAAKNEEKDATTTLSSSDSSSSDSSSSTSSDSSTSTDGIIVLTGTHTSSTEPPPETTRDKTTLTLASSSSANTGLPSATDNATESPIVSTGTVTFLTGSITTTTTGTVTFSGNFSTISASQTAPAPSATNTQPCNNYPELCPRRYSNITQVGCHNSPFVKKGNAAANQALDVTAQLDDGVRFLQGQMHWAANDTVPHFCHTTCDILDAGRITDWLGKVADWVEANRFEVVTILLENGNYSNPSLYVPYINQTGILNYVYTPPYAPMNISQWPTLAEMIIYNTRVVMFLDYMANQTAYPWWIDEFGNMWETPFDPTDKSFPCTIQRPDGLSVEAGQKLMYIANHNLNVDVSLLGTSILIPEVSSLNTTNNVTGEGSLGDAANTCIEAFGRPPTVLNVDYYNYGGTYDSGAVFKVAAAMNNVTYNGACCGKVATNDAAPKGPGGKSSVVVFLTFLALWAPLVW